MKSRRVCACALLCVLASAGVARAQTNLQFWGDLSFNWVKANGAAWALDLEPQVLIASSEDEPAWASFSATPNFEYSPTGWLDTISEVGTGYTRQTDGLRTAELTPRVGLRFYVFSRDIENRIGRTLAGDDRPPRRRLVLRDRLLVEQRNLFYSDETPTSSTVRVRNRIELQFPLNRERTTDDGARVAMVDWEWFMPIGDPDERFSNRQRVRAGLLVRRSFFSRLEVVYVWTSSRNTIDEPFTTSDNAISLTFRKFFR